jgi:uncharacterized YccA/Bax inhibitor family protein
MSSPALSRNRAFSPNPSSEYQATSPNHVMTVETTIHKTILSFAILLITAAATWIYGATNGITGGFLATVVALSLAALVIGLVNAFKKEPNPALILTYAGLEGVVVGGLSVIFENLYPGVVVQAVLATLVVIGVTLGLFLSGKIRASAKMTKFWIIAMVGYLAFSLLNFVLMATGVQDSMFGLRSVEVFGIPLGLILGIFVVLLAAYSLVMDFTFIQQGVNNRIDAKYGWTGAFGLMVTIVWLYLEILRMFAIARN